MKSTIKNLILAVIATAVTAAISVQAYAQGPKVMPDSPGVMAAMPGELPAAPPPLPGETTEKAIAVDKNVNISLCVTQGVLKINGWSRNEVRVYVNEGAKFGFKVLEKSKEAKPVWINVSAFGSKGGAGECIWGSEIEIDVPVGAVVNIKGQETQTTIDTVRKANIKTIGGDITVRNASSGVVASTYEGDVRVERSQGAMGLESTTGNILVFDVGASDIGDIIKAKTTSGMITLQGLEHRQVDVSSISGSISFNGNLLTGGVYSLTTSNGSIRMSLPPTAACNVYAVYGYGSFNSELPMKVITENIEEGPVKKVQGSIGKSESTSATLKLTTNNGSIAIKKQ